MGIFQPRQKAGVKFMGREAASSTNPNKCHSEKHKTNMHTLQGPIDH